MTSTTRTLRHLEREGWLSPPMAYVPTPGVTGWQDAALAHQICEDIVRLSGYHADADEVGVRMFYAGQIHSLVRVYQTLTRFLPVDDMTW